MIEDRDDARDWINQLHASWPDGAREARQRAWQNSVSRAEYRLKLAQKRLARRRAVKSRAWALTEVQKAEAEVAEAIGAPLPPLELAETVPNHGELEQSDEKRETGTVLVWRLTTHYGDAYMKLAAISDKGKLLALVELPGADIKAQVDAVLWLSRIAERGPASAEKASRRQNLKPPPLAGRETVAPNPDGYEDGYGTHDDDSTDDFGDEWKKGT